MLCPTLVCLHAIQAGLQNFKRFQGSENSHPNIMKRTFEALPASTGEKKPKSEENTKQNTPESTKGQLEPVILLEIVNIRTEDAQSIDDHRLLSKPELNLESIVKEEYVIQENTSEIAQTSNEEKKIGVQKNLDETSSEDIWPESQLVARSDSEFAPSSESSDDIPKLEAEKSFRRLTKDDYIVKKIICGEKYVSQTDKIGSSLINCPLCPEMINGLLRFNHHVFNHHRFYVCLACNLNFDIKTFQKHLREIHETRPLLECDACDFSFTNRLEWTFHLQSHLQKSLEKIRRLSLSHLEGHVCPFCLYSHRRKESYFFHFKREHRFFECIACNYNAASPKDLTRHTYEVHRNGDTLDCSKCRFSATSIPTYNHHFLSGDHDRGATKSDDYSCTKCFYSSKTISPVYFHLQKVHSLFCCIFCDEFETNNKAMFKRHINEKHNVRNNPRLVKCNICPYSGEKPGVSHVEHFKDQHKEAKKTTLNSIFAKGFALQISRKSQPIENDSVKQEIGEEEPSSEDALINGDDIKVEIDFCEIKNE